VLPAGPVSLFTSWLSLVSAQARVIKGGDERHPRRHNQEQQTVAGRNPVQSYPNPTQELHDPQASGRLGATEIRFTSTTCATHPSSSLVWTLRLQYCPVPLPVGHSTKNTAYRSRVTGTKSSNPEKISSLYHLTTSNSRVVLCACV